MSQRSLYEVWLRRPDLPLEVIGLHALASAYAYDQLTDGAVLGGFVRGRGATDDVIAQAVAAGLLAEDELGRLSVADYSAHNPSAARIQAERERWRTSKRKHRNDVPDGQLDVDDATLRAVDDATMSTRDIRGCPRGTFEDVHAGHSAMSTRDIAATSHTRARTSARPPSAVNQKVEETEVGGPPPGGVGGNDLDHVRLQEAIGILAACPRLAVDAEAIAAVLADFPAAEWRAACKAVVDWSAGPNVRKRPANAASALRTVLQNGSYTSPAPRSRWDLEAAAERSELQLVTACDEPVGEVLDTWLGVRRDLRDRVPAETFDLWLATLHVHELREVELVLGAPAQTAKRVRDRFNRVLASAAAVHGLTVAIEACADHRRLEIAS